MAVRVVPSDTNDCKVQLEAQAFVNQPGKRKTHWDNERPVAVCRNKIVLKGARPCVIGAVAYTQDSLELQE